MFTIYRVQNKDNPDLYHKGGIYDRWSKKGKVWTSIGQLRSFLTTAIKSGSNDVAKYRIVEYTISVAKILEPHEIIRPEKIVDLLRKS